MTKDAMHQAQAGEPSNMQRRRLLGTALLGGAALATGVLAARPAHAGLIDTLDRFLDLDPIIINFAYELEELQTDFFERAAYSKGFSELSPRERSTINLIARQDREQFEKLDQLRSKLDVRGGGGFAYPNASASKRPRTFNFGNSFDSRESLLRTAVEIKELAVASYHGAVDNVDRGNLTLAAAIAGTDGRHLAVLREIAGLDPVPTSFEMPQSAQVTGRLLGKYGFKGGGMR